MGKLWLIMKKLMYDGLVARFPVPSLVIFPIGPKKDGSGSRGECYDGIGDQIIDTFGLSEKGFKDCIKAAYKWWELKAAQNTLGASGAKPTRTCVPRTVNGTGQDLSGATGVTVAPDGKNVYAVAYNSDSIVTWDRS